MISELRAIETVYSGRRFRSRLEARWAVFFDSIGIPWIYESEGYKFRNDVAYLPDFFLPHLNSYFEVKPTKPSQRELDKCRWLAQAGKPVFLFFGNVGYADYPSGQERPDDFLDSAWKFFPPTPESGNQVSEDYGYAWCYCIQCGKFGIEFEGRSERVCRHNTDDRGHNPDHPRLIRAYDAANRARFEFCA